MYCKYCGAVIDEDAQFCPKCGKPQHGSQPVRPVQNDRPGYAGYAGENSRRRQPEYTGGHYRKKKKKHIWPIVLTVFLVLAVILGIAVCLIGGSDETTENAITAVQNGYLGQYTDFTVKELLDFCYTPRYLESEWDGGYTDEQVLIVEATYFNRGNEDNETKIQFTMLNEDCFKVTAYADPENPFEEQTDFYLALNYAFFMKYSDVHREELREEDQITAWLMNLDLIGASEVQYGAANTYQGSRADLNQLDHSDKLEVSVAMLLDAYGLVDMELVYPPALEESSGEETGDSAIQETAAPDSTEPSDAEEYVPETEPVEDSVYVEPAYLELIEVLTGNHELKLDYPDTFTNLYEITDFSGVFCDPPMEPAAFMPVDLDWDGIEEVLVELSVAGEERVYMLLRYYNGIVYGYYFPPSGGYIGADGTIVEQFDEGSYLFSHIWFKQEHMEIDSNVVTDPEGFFTDWELAEWHSMAELY